MLKAEKFESRKLKQTRISRIGAKAKAET